MSDSGDQKPTRGNAVVSEKTLGRDEHTADEDAAPPPEIGGRGGLEPTRYGDWEKNGRCIDF